jgi:hypothetical protein
VVSSHVPAFKENTTHLRATLIVNMLYDGSINESVLKKISKSLDQTFPPRVDGHNQVQKMAVSPESLVDRLLKNIIDQAPKTADDSNANLDEETAAKTLQNAYRLRLAMKNISALLGYSSAISIAAYGFSNILHTVRKHHNYMNLPVIPNEIFFQDSEGAASVQYKNQGYLLRNAISKSETCKGNSCFFHALGKTRNQSVAGLKYYLDNIDTRTDRFKNVAAGVFGQMLDDSNKNKFVTASINKIHGHGIKNTDDLLVLLANDSKEKVIQEKKTAVKKILIDYLETEWKSSARMVNYTQLSKVHVDRNPSMVDALASLYEVSITILGYIDDDANVGAWYTANQNAENKIFLLHANEKGTKPSSEVEANHFLRLIEVKQNASTDTNGAA